ncbi:protein HGH1 homolog [Chrysoperla carnea]|uniref:protein HGH1 homolog n=1 Tax=Chrysoperla carnea TaxID=189513 RepID=UPI001D090ED8|nr:protein HGH1 homolog [Chrysoperla carnea]
MKNLLKELVKFMQLGARLDLKVGALENILSLTGSNDGLEVVIESDDILKALVTLSNDSAAVIAKDAFLTLINISSLDKGASKLINLKLETNSLIEKSSPNIVIVCLQQISNPESELADPACMLLSNLTRPISLCDKIVDTVLSSNVTFDQLINIFTKNEFNKKGHKLHYLGPVLSNLSQSSLVRKYILDSTKCVIQRLLPFTEYKDSIVRRGGIVGTLKNCCFEEEFHKWLLSEDVDILPRLLLPLAGNEQFDDEDMDKLPLELQYLPDDKMREDDPDIRKMLIEAITQLCSLKENRVYIREKNTYVILRELHKWEKDREVLLACENLVDILIRTEEEINKDNIKDAEVPVDLIEKFEKMDKEFVEDSS